MEKIRSIVVPTDFSELAEAAAARAASLACLDGAAVHLVHALTFPLAIAPYEVAVPATVWEAVRQSVRERLAIARKAVEATGVQTVTAELFDSREAVSAISEAVRAHGADLIVMGTHGYGGFERAFHLGSVTERTLRAVDRPVLAVKGTAEAAAKPIAKILVAVDFSPYSDRAVEDAAGLAARLSASVDVLHAFNLPYEPDGGYLSSFDSELERKLEADVSARLEQAREPFERRRIAVRLHLRRGRPHVVIADAAREFGCELIAMGTRGRTGLAHVLLGSVAERTLRTAPCSVLCVKGCAGDDLLPA